MAERTGNRILDGLPDAAAEALLRRLEHVDLELKHSVFTRGEPIEHVYFPTTAVVSLLAEMSDGRSVEVATVGREGMAGLPVFLQATFTSAHDAFAQIPGAGLRMPAAEFAEALTANGADLQTALHRYTQALFTQVSQSSACNRLHSLEQRCARWLLLTHDRVDSDEFPLTQEFLAQMLGVQRTSVTDAAQTLQEQGAITYTRGIVMIVDRALLGRISCECYGVIAAEYDRLLP